MSKKYGYMRVSSVDQNVERQEQELIKWGILKHQIYTDKVSGKNFNRPSYQKLRKKLKERDVLVVKSIDRLGRNYVYSFYPMRHRRSVNISASDRQRVLQLPRHKANI